MKKYAPRLYVATFAIILSCIPQAGLAFDVETDQWLTNQNGLPDNGLSRVTVTEFPGSGARISMRSSYDQTTTNEAICDQGFGVEPCNPIKSRYVVSATQLLPVCETQNQENCIVSLTANKNDESIAAIFEGYGGGPEYPALSQWGLPAASRPSLWSIAGLVNGAGAETYAVSIFANYSFDIGKKRFKADSLAAAVQAFTIVANPSFEAPFAKVTKAPGSSRTSIDLLGPADCIWSDSGICGREVRFPLDASFKLTIRASKDITGWFRGRLRDPVIDVKEFSKTANLISIEASPVSIPRFSVIASPDNTTSRSKKILQNYGGNGIGLFTGSHKHVPALTYGDSAPHQLLNDFKKIAENSAIGTSTLWNFSTAPLAIGNSCLADRSKVIGIVTTNATMFEGGAPRFANGFLQYKVAGMHFMPDRSTKFLGTYDLVMRSDVARCLYRFSKAPVSATITVTGDGDKDISTTVVGEKNGWLKLAAYGFTFSQKTIRVRLSQPKTTTISCEAKDNPSRTQKVSGVDPKCPPGFKNAS